MRLHLSLLLLPLAAPGANAAITLADVQNECDNEWINMRVVFHGYMERHLTNRGIYPQTEGTNTTVRRFRTNDTDVNTSKTIPDNLNSIPAHKIGRQGSIAEDSPMGTAFSIPRACRIKIREWNTGRMIGYDVQQEFLFGPGGNLWRRTRSFAQQERDPPAREQWRSHNWMRIDDEIPGDPDP